MLDSEARWVGQILSRLDVSNLSPLLNVGSATAIFREQVQPWIDQQIFGPLRKRDVKIEHLDIQKGDGIDVTGDLTNEAFIADLCTRNYKAVVCCNVLEHVTDASAVATKLQRLVLPNGYIVVTVPNRFPYHPDPIDTMFRPDVQELARLFRDCVLLNGVILECGTGWDYVERSPSVMIQKVRRRLSGLKDHGGIKGSASFFPWLFRKFRQTCVLLQKRDYEFKYNS